MKSFAGGEIDEKDGLRRFVARRPMDCLRNVARVVREASWPLVQDDGGYANPAEALNYAESAVIGTED
jgi:hypothetical protein